MDGISAPGVFVTSGSSGSGNRIGRSPVQADTRRVEAAGCLEMAGLLGRNPNGRHHIVILKR